MVIVSQLLTNAYRNSAHTRTFFMIPPLGAISKIKLLS